MSPIVVPHTDPSGHHANCTGSSEFHASIVGFGVPGCKEVKGVPLPLLSPSISSKENVSNGGPMSQSLAPSAWANSRLPFFRFSQNEADSHATASLIAVGTDQQPKRRRNNVSLRRTMQDDELCNNNTPQNLIAIHYTPVTAKKKISLHGPCSLCYGGGQRDWFSSHTKLWLSSCNTCSFVWCL